MRDAGVSMLDDRERSGTVLPVEQARGGHTGGGELKSSTGGGESYAAEPRGTGGRRRV